MSDFIVIESARDTTVVQVVETTHTVITVHPGGPIVPNGSGAARPIDFTQSIASTEWVFNHTLNRKPCIEVTDLAGNCLLVETQATTTQAIVRSAFPITGIVYLF
jgi:hypothetical protein